MPYNKQKGTRPTFPKSTLLENFVQSCPKPTQILPLLLKHLRHIFTLEIPPSSRALHIRQAQECICLIEVRSDSRVSHFLDIPTNRTTSVKHTAVAQTLQQMLQHSSSDSWKLWISSAELPLLCHIMRGLRKGKSCIATLKCHTSRLH